MSTRMPYKSRHREQILSILQQNEGEHMTAGQILDQLRVRGVSIGVATIYRQLDRLVEEHGGESGYVHCKCEKCGKLVRLERKRIEAAMQSLSGSGGDGGFELDCARTLFYGICRDCRGRR